MQIHHASQSGGESKSVLDTAVSVQSHQSVPFGHVVQKTEFFVIRQEQEQVEEISQLPSQSLFFVFFFLLSFYYKKMKKIRNCCNQRSYYLPVFVVGEKSVGPNSIERKNKFRRLLGSIKNDF